eukprot:1152171-Pelagomonas_calceolata.AAC.1
MRFRVEGFPYAKVWTTGKWQESRARQDWFRRCLGRLPRLQVALGLNLQPGSLAARPAQLFQPHTKYP